ncbi:PREDICTED: uncharacterized protein LOC109580542 isoform X2 [Amphimedon queenslandica]|uniref:Autophagy-related protein 16 domain-containing protein n=1 Tax=Amphimedon queenslandica TaxID=400682 RepID=A0AAN0IXA4_AMPQE|nr:PREDICTED: uncharacterized protein LOC109580542 isoform X2 [Amphimedon queenslandica]|eukprot:XP_019849399.1 PREDICTED: uncharacterized protein LOC109580542 isoform X2 [Amphimedon queenslandica]
MSDGDSWKLYILRKLRERNSKETSCFKELILSHGRLFDQVENLKKDITRLEYQNNELERDLREGGGSTGGGANKLNKRVEDLQERLLTRTDEVSEACRATADAMVKVTELSSQVRSKDDEISKKETQILSHCFLERDYLRVAVQLIILVLLSVSQP